MSFTGSTVLKLINLFSPEHVIINMLIVELPSEYLLRKCQNKSCKLQIACLNTKKACLLLGHACGIKMDPDASPVKFVNRQNPVETPRESASQQALSYL